MDKIIFFYRYRTTFISTGNIFCDVVEIFKILRIGVSYSFRMPHILVMAPLLFYATLALEVNLKDKDLASVPQNINHDVTDLILDNNEIMRITRMSFALYTELVILSIKQSNLKFIEDGSFDYNSKLHELHATGNQII